MKLLLDTHIALWLLEGGSRLKPEERRLLESADTDIAVSAVSLWEVRLKWSSLHASGARKGTASPADLLDIALRSEFNLLPLEARHAVAELSHPIEHKDPFDELLLVQAQEEGLRLLTRDAKLSHHPLAVTA